LASRNLLSLRGSHWNEFKAHLNTEKGKRKLRERARGNVSVCVLGVLYLNAQEVRLSVIGNILRNYRAADKAVSGGAAAYPII
jgi:hypothetical protein